MAAGRKKGSTGRGARRSSGRGGKASSSRGGYKGPSTQPVSEGLEGSILEGASGYGDTEGQRKRGSRAQGRLGDEEAGDGM
jgi:hypothetical protein